MLGEEKSIKNTGERRKSNTGALVVGVVEGSKLVVGSAEGNMLVVGEVVGSMLLLGVVEGNMVVLGVLEGTLLVVEEAHVTSLQAQVPFVPMFPLQKHSTSGHGPEQS